MATAGAASVPISGVGSTGGRPSAGQAGSGGGADVSLAGSPQAAGGKASSGPDFSHGSRLVIPQRTLTSVHLGPDGNFNDINGNGPGLDQLDVTTNSEFADAPIYSRQFEVNFGMPGLFVKECQVWTGKFEVSTLDVKQDVSGSGAHLKIELVNGRYLLTHDGPGTHQIRVTGNFRADRTPDSGGYCAALPMGAVSVPIAFTTNINIQRMGSVSAAPLRCAAGAFMLSGRKYPGTSINVLNEAGQPFRPDNVYDSYPLDVIVETEKPAQIAETEQGLHYDGLVVTGEPQTVRLSTSYGTLFTYQLANTALIDGWDIEFWSRDSTYVKAVTYPMAMDSTPVITPGKVLGATATLKVGGVPLCGPTLASDFMVGLPSPDVCKVVYENSPDPNPGTPGFLATFVEPAGRLCEVDLSVPGANGERGLSKRLSAIFAPVKK